MCPGQVLRNFLGVLKVGREFLPKKKDHVLGFYPTHGVMHVERNISRLLVAWLGG